MDEVKSKADVFGEELHGALLRRKLNLPKRKPQKLVHFKILSGQKRLAPVPTSRRALVREEIYARNMRLAEEQMRYDAEVHERRKQL